MYIMYSCQMFYYGKNKFLINQSVEEENKPVFILVYKLKKNKRVLFYSSKLSLSSSDVELIISNRRRSCISIQGNARRCNADINEADVLLSV